MSKFNEIDYSFYKIRTSKGFQLHIEKPYEGTVHITEQEHGGESYDALEFIEFDSEPTPEEVEEIETYIENHLYEIMEKAEKI